MARSDIDPKKVRAISDRIKPVTEVNPYVKLCAYGRNGSGKTRLGASGPNTLIIDINEEGTRSVRHTKSHVIECNNFEDVGYAAWLLQGSPRLKGGGLKVRTKGGPIRVQCLCIDTTTALNGVAMRQVLGDAEERDPSREPSMPDKRTYGRAGELVKAQILMFRNLPVHVIFLAQERTERDEDTGEVILTTADLPKGSRGTLLGACGIIGRIYPQQVKARRKGKVVRVWEDRLLVGPSEDYDTKDRTNALGNIVRSPTMNDIIKIWRENPPDDEEE